MCRSNPTHYTGRGLQFFIVPDAALITKSHPPVTVSKPHLAIYFGWGWRKKTQNLSTEKISGN